MSHRNIEPKIKQKLTDDMGRPLKEDPIIVLTDEYISDKDIKAHRMREIYKSWNEHPPEEKSFREKYECHIFLSALAIFTSIIIYFIT